MLEPSRIQQAIVVVVIAGATLWAGTVGRPSVLRYPIRTLALLVAADAAWLGFVTTPFVPSGVDECYFAINAHCFRGADLYFSWIRTPLPGLLAALMPDWPLLGGVAAKELAAVFVFAAAVRPLGTVAALWAAWLTIVSTRLSRDAAELLGETCAAAAVAGFVCFASRAQPRAAALAAGLGFVSRWQLGILAPLALIVGWRARRAAGALECAVLAALPALVLVPATGADPWRALLLNRGHGDGLLDRLGGYLRPDLALGLGAVGLALAVVGTLARAREPVVGIAAAAFAALAGSLLAVGTVMPNYTTALVPAGSMLIAAGSGVLLRHRLLPERPRLVAALAALVAVLHAIPVRAPRRHEVIARSPIAAVAAERERLRSLIGDAPLYSELEFLAVCAILGRPVHAVVGPGTEHPTGVSMDWEGELDCCSRDELTPGSLLLTRSPAARRVLWSGGGLFLVRW